MGVLERIDTLPAMQEVLVLMVLLAGYVALVIFVVASVKARCPKAFTGVSPSVLSPLGAIFGLTAAFLSSDIWDNEAAALRAVNNEARALSQIVAVARALDNPVRERVQSDVDAYVRLVLEKEWPILDDISDPYNAISIEARGHLYNIIFQISKYSDSNIISEAAASKIENLVDEAFGERTNRIVIAINHISYTKLYLTVILGLTLILGVAIIHSAGRSALIGMTIGAGFVVGLVICTVVAKDEPFEAGSSRVDPYKFFNVGDEASLLDEQSAPPP